MGLLSQSRQVSGILRLRAKGSQVDLFSDHTNAINVVFTPDGPELALQKLDGSF